MVLSGRGGVDTITWVHSPEQFPAGTPLAERFYPARGILTFADPRANPPVGRRVA